MLFTKMKMTFSGLSLILFRTTYWPTVEGPTADLALPLTDDCSSDCSLQASYPIRLVKEEAAVCVTIVIISIIFPLLCVWSCDVLLCMVWRWCWRFKGSCLTYGDVNRVLLIADIILYGSAQHIQGSEVWQGIPNVAA